MNTSSPVTFFYEISLQNMFHLWNIKILRSNYKVTSRVNYGIEISSKYNPRQKCARENLKDFTNEYGLGKSPVGMDDIWAFVDFKRK